MEKIVYYKSVLGGIFSSREAAKKDEEMLPVIIKVYEEDFERAKKLIEINDISLEIFEATERGVERYKTLWKIAQKSWEDL